MTPGCAVEDPLTRCSPLPCSPSTSASVVRSVTVIREVEVGYQPRASGPLFRNAPGEDYAQGPEEVPRGGRRWRRHPCVTVSCSPVRDPSTGRKVVIVQAFGEMLGDTSGSGLIRRIA